MALSIASLGVLGHMPMRNMSISDSFQLEVSAALKDIRAAANTHKCNPELAPYRQSELRYLVGVLHGVIFGFSTLLIYRTGTFDELNVIGDSARHEAEFLTGEYLA